MGEVSPSFLLLYLPCIIKSLMFLLCLYHHIPWLSIRQFFSLSSIIDFRTLSTVICHHIHYLVDWDYHLILKILDYPNLKTNIPLLWWYMPLYTPPICFSKKSSPNLFIGWIQCVHYVSYAIRYVSFSMSLISLILSISTSSRHGLLGFLRHYISI
jgi:hypothetical protein